MAHSTKCNLIFWHQLFILKSQILNKSILWKLVRSLEKTFCNKNNKLLCWKKNLQWCANLIFEVFCEKWSISFCSDFLTKITCSGWFLFLQTNFDFFTSTFWWSLKDHSKGIVALSLNLKKYFICDYCSETYEDLTITILANSRQLMCDIFHAINV